jgi:RNA polymerase sigma-70 factor (ECF subfamily)
VDSQTLGKNYEKQTEPDIISACQGGDLEAFNELIRRYEKRVLNTAFRYLRDYQEAVDAAQEIFLKVFRKLGGFQGKSTFGTWLYRVVNNHCLNIRQKHQQAYGGRSRMISLDAAREDNAEYILSDTKTAAPDVVYKRKKLEQDMAAAIAQLPDDQRQVIILRHYESLRYEQIAGIMEQPTTTICSCLHRARQRLKSILEKKAVRKGGTR